MCWELSIAAADPNYVPSEKARDALTEYLRSIEPTAYDIRGEMYPTPVYWQNWSMRMGESWADLFCPICNTQISEWFESLSLPRFRQLAQQHVELEVLLPCCETIRRVPDLDFAGEKHGFARFFAVIEEPDSLDLEADSPLGLRLRRAEALAGCRLIEFVSDNWV